MKLYLIFHFVQLFCSLVIGQDVTSVHDEHVYQIFKTIKLIHEDAQQFCLNLGGYLVSINDVDESELVSQLFLATNSNLRSFYGREMLIGLTTDTCSSTDFINSDWGGRMGRNWQTQAPSSGKQINL